MARPSRIAIVKELGSRTPRCLAAHAVRGEDHPELVVVERYPVALGAEVLATIEEDAKSLSTLDHPTLASLIATAKLKGDVAVLSEWVDGESLASALGATDKPELPVLLRAVVDVLDALGALHAKGAVCGTFTSEDVFLGVDGVTRLTRFNLARVPLDALGERRKTYAAPELLRGERSPAGDVFAAGILLWECFMGEAPSRDPSWGVRTPDVSKREPWASGLVEVVDKACALEPGARYASAAEMSRAIASAAPQKVASRAATAAYVARAFGERITTRFAKLAPKTGGSLSDLPPSLTPPPPTPEPKAVAEASPPPPEKPVEDKEKPPPEPQPQPATEKAVEKPPEPAPKPAPAAGADRCDRESRSRSANQRRRRREHRPGAEGCPVAEEGHACCCARPCADACGESQDERRCAAGREEPGAFTQGAAREGSSEGSSTCGARE